MPANVFYFLESLPWFYWLGLVLPCATIVALLSTSLVETTGESMKALLVIALWIAIDIVPLFLFALPYFEDFYLHFSPVLWTAKTGHILPFSSISSIGYEAGQWPIAYVFYSMAYQILGLSPVLFNRLIVAVLSGTILLFIYYVSRLAVGARYAFIAPIVWISFEWDSFFHLAPETFAMALFILLIGLLAFGKNRRQLGVPLTLLILILVAGEPFTPIASLVTLASLIVFYCLVILIEKKRIFWNYNQLLMSFVFMLFVWISWQEFAARPALDYISKILTSILASVRTVTIAPYLHPTLDYELLIYARQAVYALQIGLTILATTVLFLGHRRDSTYFKSLAWWVGVMSLAVPVFASFSNLYGFENRPFYYSLVPTGILLALVIFRFGSNTKLKPVRFIIAGTLAASLLLMPFATYGGAFYEYTPQSSVLEASFNIQNAPVQNLTLLVTGTTGHEYDVAAVAFGFPLDDLNYSHSFFSPTLSMNLVAVDSYSLQQYVKEGMFTSDYLSSVYSGFFNSSDIIYSNPTGFVVAQQ